MKRVALIGLGMVAGTHAAAIAASAPGIVLHGVLATRTARAQAFSQDYATTHAAPPPRVYADLSALASDTDLDFVILCTPPNARAEIVETLTQAGLPILMEKPIERSYDAARAIVETCEAASLPLGIVFQHRMRAASQKLRSMLLEKALGDIALVEIAVPWWRGQGYYDEPGRGTYARDGGGVLISQAIHTLDLALSLAGPVHQVQAMTRTTRLHQMESEDFVTAGLQFASGAVGSLVASTASFPGGAESIVIHGTSGSARLQSGQLVVDWQAGGQDVHGETVGTGGGADPMAFPHDWHQGIIEDFAQALDTGHAPIASGRAALLVHQLIEALTQSSHEARAINIETGADQ